MSMSVPERSDALDSEQRRSQEKTDAVQVAEPFAFAHTTPSELDDRVVDDTVRRKEERAKRFGLVEINSSRSTETSKSQTKHDILKLETLPDTSHRYLNVGGNFFTGIDVSSVEAVRRREERVKRFGLEKLDSTRNSVHNSPETNISKLESRFKKFGTNLLLRDGQPVKCVGSLPSVPLGMVRPEAVHVHGTSEMSTGDVFRVFTAYCPRNIEWIDDHSCNVVWEDELSAQRALAGLKKQPVAVFGERKEEEEEKVEEEEEKEGKEERREATTTLNKESTCALDSFEPGGGAVGEKGGEGEGGGEGKGEMLGEKRGMKVVEEEEEGMMETENPAGENGVQWWLAPPHPKAKQLLVRQATTGDQKKPRSAQHSHYYRVHGNPNIPNTFGTYTRKQKARGDLRNQLGRNRAGSNKEEEIEEEDGEEKGKEEGEEEEKEEGMETEGLLSDPLAFLVKRPKLMHADRKEEDDDEEEEEERERLKERKTQTSEEQKRGEEGSGGGGGGGGGGEKGSGVDLRKLLKKKRKWRDLQLRLGHSPRIVEERR